MKPRCRQVYGAGSSPWYQTYGNNVVAVHDSVSRSVDLYYVRLRRAIINAK